MSARTIENPGVEINEIDRSQYGKIDYSLQNAPTVLTMGFASKGEDLALTWINSKATLDDTYGKPTTEYESYFYNSIYEILRRGGTCIAAKLPYDNESYNKFNYVEYSYNNVDFNTTLSNIIPIVSQEYQTIDDIQRTLIDVMVILNEEKPYSTILEMKQTIEELYDKYADDETYQPQINALVDLKNSLEAFINQISAINPDFAALYLNDSYLDSCLSVKFNRSGKSDIDELDKYLTNNRMVAQNTIRIYDMTRTQYSQLNSYNGCVVSRKNEEIFNTNDCLGIVPVIVTPFNAMFFQNILNFNGMKSVDFSVFNQISSFNTVQFNETPSTSISSKFIDIDSHSVVPLQSIAPISSYSNGYNYESLSKIASEMFPQINYNGPGHYDKINLKNIGIVVFKAYADINNDNKLNFELLESFIGSLNKNAKDPITQANIFIDNVVNSQSQYIRVFSNANQSIIENIATIAMSKQPVVSLGFYNVDCSKIISYQLSLMESLQKVFANADNSNTLPLDIIIDGGISNIAQLAYVSINKLIDTNAKPNIADVNWRLIESGTDVSGWKAILQKFDNFAKYNRKDCMFIADGIRSMCLDGNAKYIRKTAPANTVSNTIIPKFRYMTNVINSSYSAGYCNWFYVPDYSVDANSFFWCPPSIKLAGVYIYCSTYFHPWSAPAGQTRGLIDDAIDVAFTPLDSDAGQIYSNQWNYAMSYPLDGIVVEGHKTFQSQKTALDRVNVRRLLLDIEKKIERIARRFVYEGNTPYLRQSFVDNVKVVLEDAVAGDGIKEYAIKCDDELNTTEVIENNEMRCKIAIKPVKCVDFIVIDLIATRQSANVNEEVLR